MTRHTPCWSCRGPVQDPLFCSTCGAIQPPDPREDHFSRLGQPLGFPVDLQALEEAYRQRQLLCHPDRFASRSDRERRLAMEQVTALNTAWQTLKAPLARGRYLLELAGRHGGSEEGGAAPGDPLFLMEVMERREALEAIDLNRPDAGQHLEAMRQQVERDVAQEEAALQACFAGFVDAHASGGLGGDPAWQGRLDRAGAVLDRLRYHARFLEEVDRMEEQAFAL